MARTWLLRLGSFSVWGLAAFSIVFWALRLLQQPTPGLPVAVAPLQAVQADAASMVRVFGRSVVKPVNAAAPERPLIDPSTRFVLLGVAAQRNNQGVALIAVDGKPARPYRIGGKIEDGYVLRSVSKLSATLYGESDGNSFTVELRNQAVARPATAASAALSKASS